MVVCFGADGHVSVELEHQGHCHEATDEDHHTPQHGINSLAEAGHSDDCTDVALHPDAMARLISKVKRNYMLHDSLLAPLACANSALFFCTISPRDASPPRGYPPGRALALRIQRTIVLRT